MPPVVLGYRGIQKVLPEPVQTALDVVPKIAQPVSEEAACIHL